MPEDRKTYNSASIKSSKEALEYHKIHDILHRYIAYRDLPSLLDKYSQKGLALDYGSGTGYSAQFLSDLGFKVTGVDVSKEMVSQATSKYPKIPFYHVKKHLLPFSSNTYNLVFSSFVLLELGTEEEIISYLKEAKRVLKKDGTIVVITGSQDMYSKNWIIFDTNYPENKNLKSGDKAKVFLTGADIEFTDYYWTDADYRLFFQKAELTLIDVHYPLGKTTEPYPWKDELQYAPFVVFVAKPI